MKKTVFSILLAFIVVSCSNPAVVNKPKEEDDTVKTVTVYQCPVHPDIESVEPGTCSECGAELEKTVK